VCLTAVIQLTQRRSEVISIPVSYSEDPGFESRPH
jgi:hypothetical protein